MSLSDDLGSKSRARLSAAAAAHAAQALLVALGPVMVVLGLTLDPREFLPAAVPPEWWLPSLIGAAGALSTAGLCVMALPRLSAALTALGFLAFGALVAPGLAYDPQRALIVVLASVAVMVRVRTLRPLDAVAAMGPDPITSAHPKVFRLALENAGGAALLAWFLAGPTDLATGPIAHAATFVAFGVSGAYALIWLTRSVRHEPWVQQRSLLTLLPATAFAVTQIGDAHRLLLALASVQGTFLALAWSRKQKRSSLVEGIVEHPARLLVSAFLLLSLVGGVVLALPVCAANAQPLGPINAFFTAMSAACVSGLSTVEIGAALSPAGQLVVLVLMQLGGIGIMAVSTGGVLLLGRRLGLRHERAVGGLLADDANLDAYSTARRLLSVTFLVETVGALALFGLYQWHGLAPADAAWHAVFTSVSAFCNAGFSLDPNSFEAYRGDGLLLDVVGLLVSAGSLGVPALLALPPLLRRQSVPLQARLVWITTAVLLVLPAAAVAALDWNGALADFSVIGKAHHVWFAVTTPRTAGFHALPAETMHPVTHALMMVLMFIGGSPFSTAGGVKTTTVALLVLSVVAALRGNPDVTAFGRKIAPESVSKAIAIVSLYCAFAMVGFTGLMLTQKLEFEVALYEVISALGTVGLSLGATAHLDGVGKIILMFCMFAGRVGPLTLFLLLAERRRANKWTWPEERVAVG
jgi:trk system potassium uptake protein TrkH